MYFNYAEKHLPWAINKSVKFPMRINEKSKGSKEVYEKVD